MIKRIRRAAFQLRQVTVKNSANVPLLGLARIKWVVVEDCMEMIYVPASFSSWACRHKRSLTYWVLGSTEMQLLLVERAASYPIACHKSRISKSWLLLFFSDPKVLTVLYKNNNTAAEDIWSPGRQWYCRHSTVNIMLSPPPSPFLSNLEKRAHLVGAPMASWHQTYLFLKGACRLILGCFFSFQHISERDKK